MRKTLWLKVNFLAVMVLTLLLGISVLALPVGAQGGVPMSSGALTAYADDAPTEFTVTFVIGKATMTQTVQTGQTASFPTDVGSQGYTFGGWEGKDESDVDVLTGDPITSNVTFTAILTPRPITVTLELGGGSLDAGSITGETDVTVDYESVAGLTAYIPELDAYHEFSGWFIGNTAYTDDLGNVNWKLVTETLDWESIDLELTLTAKYKPATAMVELYSDPGVKFNEIEITYFGKYPTLPEPNKTGHTFKGWFIDIDDPDSEVEAGDDVVNDADTLTAKWERNQYTVTYNANGGTVTPAFVKDYYEEAFTVSVPTRDGYVFDGWYDNAAFAGQKVENGIFTANITLYAKWLQIKYKVTFHYGLQTVGGGYQKTQEPPVKVWGNTVTTPDPVVFGWGFDGWTWKLESTGAEIDVDYTNNNTVTVNFVDTENPQSTLINVNCYASYTVKTSAITLDAGDGSFKNGHTPAVTEINFGNINFGQVFNLTTNAAYYQPTRDGYVFKGFEDQNGVQYTDATGKNVKNTWDKEDADVTLTAIWHETTYTVLFVTDDPFNPDDNYVVNPRAVKFNEPYGTLPRPIKDIEKGVVFVGWYADTALTIPVENSTVVTKAFTHTLYAKWEEFRSYTISFDGNKDTTTVFASKTIVMYGYYGTLPEPEAEGYTFRSWQAGSEGSRYDVNPNTVMNIAGNHTLYADFIANEYTVNFQALGGTTPSPKTVTFGEKYGPLMIPVLENCVFKGWYLDGALIDENTVVTRADNHVLLAKWEKVTITIKYNTMKGKALTASEGEYGSELTLKTPERKHYVFAGWYTDKDLKNAYTGETYEQNITLYAKWNATGCGCTGLQVGLTIGIIIVVLLLAGVILILIRRRKISQYWED